MHLWYHYYIISFIQTWFKLWSFFVYMESVFMSSTLYNRISGIISLLEDWIISIACIYVMLVEKLFHLCGRNLFKQRRFGCLHETSVYICHPRFRRYQELFPSEKVKYCRYCLCDITRNIISFYLSKLNFKQWSLVCICDICISSTLRWISKIISVLFKREYKLKTWMWILVTRTDGPDGA